MKRLLSLILSLTLTFSLIPSAFASSDEENTAALILQGLGLFSGTGTDINGNPIFDLDRAPTRHEAVTMLVRLLGKGDEAENGTWSTPFTDVADWAKPYVGYAYTNGLTAGTSATTYGGNSTITAAQYLTFVLTALNYKNGIDFQWDKAWELSDKIGLTDGQYRPSENSISRGNVAIISKKALTVSQKDGKSLLDTLKERQVIDSDAALELNRRFIHYDIYADLRETVGMNLEISSIAVSKIGDNYRFEITVDSDADSIMNLFPAGLQSGVGNELSYRYAVAEGKTLTTFTLPAAFFLENAVNRNRMTIQFINLGIPSLIYTFQTSELPL